MSQYYYGNQTGKVSVLLDGVLRHVCNPEVFQNLFNGWIDPAKMTRYDGTAPIEEGQPLSTQARLIKTADAAEVYLIDDDGTTPVKRWIPSADFFNSMDFDWGKIRVVSQTEAAVYPMGRPLSSEKPDLYREWERKMQALGESQHPGSKVSIEFRNKGTTVDAVCWYGDGFNTPSGGGVIGTFKKS